MSIKLRDLLGRFRAIESVDLAAVVATDGLLIESTAREDVDVDAICAVASNSLAMAESLGREIDKGGALQTMLEYEHGLVLIEPISDDAMLLLLAGSRDDLGYVRFLVAKHRDDMGDALREI
ncbi:roadblock/LC7 domain-containing protein [Oscillochloris sp. ZM17-4]|uniref:roadblock/LC7 domain-containing protein n=1 Tax=Oscillochloris sp. ZM17-4 TaxID=2866714 RepID=UPI001C729E61|nr:roadblock/LC7 domain-containing protein [Oscillochloris sp. ZM17-4]MBX0327522.1 roadblock/LC7 domain-containing protein [Oscillochloris sp. ZM17-4]